MSITPHDQIQVLHVDDEPSLTDLTATFLEREDDRFTVETATSATDGLEIIDDRPPGCVVSDYNMPGMDGLEFLQTVREDDPDLPFILFTGKGSEAIASRAIAADVTDYLQKESGSEQYELLANRIENAVTNYRSQRVAQQRKERLEQIQDLMANMEELADAGAWEYNSETERLMITDGTRRLYGLDPDAVLTLEKAVDAVHPEDRDRLADRFNTCLETGQPYETEVRLTRPDGEQRWITARGERVTGGASGNVVRGYIQDITERRRRQQELRRNKRAMDEAPVGITISDPSQDNNPLIYVNDRFEEVTGYDEDETVGRNCRFLQGDDTREEPVTQMREAIDAQDPVTVELRNYRKDGTGFWNHVSVAPIENEDGEVTNYVGFQENITERKRYEQQLERQNKRLNEFTSVVSHDLRSPLNVAHGRLELAREECNSEHLDDVAHAHSRIEALIQDLLTLAREGKEAVDTESVALAEVTESSWRTVETERATLETNVPQVIEADRSRLQELFENLERNAVEHGGDDVTVHVGEIDAGFYVADTGPGVPDSDCEEIFEAGYSTNEAGTGLGLWIVKKITDAHGWEIAVTESEQGGARFEVTGVEFADR